ncbi:MAG: hypothetical protein ACRC62_39610 [Microcoleus sp.]
MHDCIIGADFGGSGTKELHYLRRTVGTELQTLLEHNLISSNVEEIDEGIYRDESANPPTTFGTGTVAFSFNGKMQYYQVGGPLLKRTATNIPKWKSALVKLLCILGWIERKSPGTNQIKTAIRFVLPKDELAYVNGLVLPLKAATLEGFECNGNRITRIQIDSLQCKAEGAGLVHPKKAISAAIMAGYKDLSFMLAARGAIAPDISFPIKGAGALQVLRLSRLPDRDELGACAAIATGNLKFFVDDGLPLSEVKILLKEGLRQYAAKNADGFAEIRNRLVDYGLEAIAFGGGSSFLEPVIRSALGVDLIAPNAEDFLEAFPDADPAIACRFMDIWGIFKQVPQMVDYFDVVEAPTVRMEEVA